MAEYSIIEANELDVGERIVVEIDGKEIGIFNIEGEYFAVLNWCVHQSGPTCEGKLTGTLEANYDSEKKVVTTTWEQEGEVICCPWHGWEYNVKSGDCLSNNKLRIPTYPVHVDDGEIVVSM